SWRSSRRWTRCGACPASAVRRSRSRTARPSRTSSPDSWGASRSEHGGAYRVPRVVGVAQERNAERLCGSFVVVVIAGVDRVASELGRSRTYEVGLRAWIQVVAARVQCADVGAHTDRVENDGGDRLRLDRRDADRDTPPRKLGQDGGRPGHGRDEIDELRVRGFEDRYRIGHPLVVDAELL